MRGDAIGVHAVASALKGPGDGDVPQRWVRHRRLKVCPIILRHVGEDLGDGATVRLCAFLLLADLVEQAHGYCSSFGSPASAGNSSAAG